MKSKIKQNFFNSIIFSGYTRIRIFILCFIIFQTVVTFGQNKSTDFDEKKENLKQISIILDSIKVVKTLEEKIKFYNYLDYYYNKVGNNDSSIYYSNLAYSKISYINDNHRKKIILNNYGRCNIDFGNFNEAIRIYTEGFTYFDNIKDTTNARHFLNLISSAYRMAKDYKNQLLYSRKSLNYISSSNFKYEYTNLGDSYMNLNILDSALFYFNTDYENSLNDTLKYKSIPLINLGEVNYKLNNYEIALTYFKKGLSIFGDDLIKKLVTNFYYPEIYLDFAKCYNKLNKLDSSFYYARKSYAYAKSIEYKSELVKSAEFLYKLFEQNRVFDSAYHYQNIYLKLNDSLYSAEKVRQLEFNTIQERIKQSKIQEEIEKVRDEREKNLILAAIGFFIPVFISMVFLVSKWNKNIKFLSSLGIASLLMLFEFINLLIHPLLDKITHHNVILMYIILLIIASALVPLHHRMEKFVRERFSNN